HHRERDPRSDVAPCARLVVLEAPKWCQGGTSRARFAGMTLPQRILSAVDFSETSLRALDVAAQWSRRFDRPLTLAHIFDPAPMGPSAEVPYPAWPSVAASKALEQSARERLTTLAAAKL